MSDVFMRGHQKRPHCQAGANKQHMLAQGYKCISEGSFPYLVAREAERQMPNRDHDIVETVFTEYSQPRFGRPEVRTDTSWLRPWIIALFNDDERHEYTQALVAPEKAYGAILAKAIQDTTARSALEAAYALGGWRAVRAFVETGAMRAQRLLVRAASLRSQALTYEELARAEDPNYKLGDDMEVANG